MPGGRACAFWNVRTCTPFLDAQIRAIAPRIIVTLGRPAANHVLGRDAPISALRALNYPEQHVPPQPGQLRAGAHTDYGSLTILLPQPGSKGS